MSDSEEKLQANSYIWSQSDDQVTISILVPENCKGKDLDIVIEQQYVRAGVKGQEPVLKGKLFAPVRHYDSLWQIEKNTTSPFSSLTTSPSLSIASSYAFMSSPNHSPNSSMILPAPALTESQTNDPELADIYQQTAALGSVSAHSSSPSVAEEMSFQPASPILLSTPPNAPGEASPAQTQQQKYRILTIHLEKEQEGMEWAVPVSKGWKSDMDIDLTSAYHLGGWFESRMGDYENAFRYYHHAAERGHIQSMRKVAALYELGTDVSSLKPIQSFEKDPKKAFEWYKRAADATENSPGGGPDPISCYIVGNSYGGGLPEAEVEKDYEMALYYLNRAMNATAPRINFDFGILEQEHIPASYLRNHTPHSQDERYFCSAAFQTGLIYLYGSQPEGETVHSKTHVDVDPHKALRYWKEAAVLGHAQASYNIAIMYANGMGVNQDLFEAGKWFGRALKLDTTGKLVVPDGVTVVEWEATKEQKKEKAVSEGSDKKQKKMKKRRARRQRKQQSDDVLLGILLAVGSAVAVAGAIWWYKRSNRSN